MLLMFKNFVRQLACSCGFYVAKIKPTDDENLARFMAKLRANSALVDLVRIGGDADGGYLVPADLQGVAGCFSPGVSTTSDFEYELATSHGIPCFLADHSVEGPAVQHEKFSFIRKFLSSTNDQSNVRLADWVDSERTRLGTGDLILQMDIEGAEYPVLLDLTSDVLAQFRVVIVEFHYLERMFDRNEFAVIEKLFDHLIADFSIVHVHPNNNCPVFQRGNIEIPSVVEFTFLRNDRIANRQPLTFSRHPLDRKNNVNRPELSMPDCWQA